MTKMSNFVWLEEANKTKKCTIIMLRVVGYLMYSCVGKIKEQNKKYDFLSSIELKRKIILQQK